MEWAKLLSTEKLSSEPPEPDSFKEYPINAFEKYYSRIVSSAAFRRLQDKTQVFPLDKSDFIRTRLTHSIEVSTIARQLGIMISKNTTQYKPTDIAVPESTPILADADGTVTVANALDSWGGSYGYYVQIDHGSGLQTLYAHCCQVCVTQGQQVQARQVIAYVGHTGRATGNHLHFEVRENGERVDAMSYYQ